MPWSNPCGDLAIERLLFKEPERRSAWLAGAEQARIEHLTIEVDNLDETTCALSDLGVRSLCLGLRRGGPRCSD